MVSHFSTVVYQFYLIFFLAFCTKLTLADDSGLFFNSAPYSSVSKDDDSWKETEDANPWLVVNPNAPSGSARKDDIATNSNSQQSFQSAQNQPLQMSQNQPIQSIQNQRNSMTGGLVVSQLNQNIGSPSTSNSGGQVRDIYLQRVNTGQQLGQKNNQGPPVSPPQEEEPVQGSLGSRYNPNSWKKTKVYSSKQETPRRAHPVNPTPTTTTTSSTTTKYGDGMFFNAGPYKANQNKGNEQEEEWKRKDEPNPFLIEDPNQPKQIQNAPQNQNFGRRDPAEMIQQQRSQQGENKSPPQEWKTKWQYEEEEAELKRKTLEKAKHPPPTLNKVELYEKRVNVQHERKQQQQRQDRNRPPDGPNGPLNNMPSFGMQREDLERSGEVDRVPKDFYKGKLGTLAPDFKFMEPDPDPEPIVLDRHSKSKPKGPKAAQLVTIDEDPPTGIKRMKNWFVRNPSSGSSVARNGWQENFKLFVFIGSVLLNVYI